MSFKTTLLAGAIALIPTLSLAHMVVEDAYARAASAVAVSGAAFMSIFNHSDQDDRLVSATSDVAERIELHTHIMEDNGVMRMTEIEGGIELPAGETILLERGGLHVMFLGLTRPLNHGDEVTLTLEFEHADPVSLTIPVDLERQPEHGGHGHMNHGEMDHGEGAHDGHDHGSHDHGSHDHGTDG